MTGSKPVALPLGDTPVSNPPAIAGQPLRRQAFLQGRTVEAHGPRNRASLAAGPTSAAFGRIAIGECREHATAGAGQARLASRGSQASALAHLGTAPGHDRFAIVASTCLQEAANCRLGGFPCQFRSLKHVGRADPDPRKDDGVVPVGQFQGGQALPDPLAPGAFARGRKGARRRPARGRAPRAARPRRRPQISLSATRVVAASELPPPSPPWMGMRFSSRMSTPGRDAPAAWRRRAARTQRSSASGDVRQAPPAGGSRRRLAD